LKQVFARGRSAQVRSGLASLFTIATWKITAANAAALRRCTLALLSLALLWPSAAMANVQALFNPDVVEQAPFPNDRFTVPNPANITRLQVNLPLPDCTTHPSDCNDLRVIDTLDGFNVNPRLSIPFSGPIDLNTVSSDTVFLVNLGKGRHLDDRIGINQVVWDPAANTLHAKSDQLLEQDTPYVLVVTDGVHDTAGSPVQPSATFTELLGENFETSPYLAKLSEALDKLSQGEDGKENLSNHIVVASVFTTQSVSAILEKIRRQIAASTPAPASFLLGPGDTRTVFPLADITSITLSEETGTAPSFTPFNLTPLLAALKVIPNVVGRLAFGKYSSPDYEVHPGEFIPPVGTRTGVPIVQRTNDVHFVLVLPSGPRPESGWPVAIFGHGSTPIADFVAFVVAAKMAQHGIATICIQAVGHGFGPLSTVTVTQSGGGSIIYPWGGRGVDQDGDGDI
jgi:Bacterial virulence factor lipase N-terminal